MTHKELLKGRFIQIADYPGSENKTGTVIPCTSIDAREYYQRYPAIYRELQWFERRKPEEMPQYVSFVAGFDWDETVREKPTIPVEDWQMENCSMIFREINPLFFLNCGIQGCKLRITLDQNWIPATEAEYRAFNSKYTTNYARTLMTGNTSTALQSDVRTHSSKVSISTTAVGAR